MNRYFQNPANGYVERATSGWTWLWALLFGPFFFLYKGAWPHVLVYVGALVWAGSSRRLSIADLIATVVWIAYAVAAAAIVRTRYRQRGWRETNSLGTALRGGKAR